MHCQRLLWSGRFSKGNSRRLGWSPRPFFHRLRGRRHLRGSNPVSAHAKQGGGNVGHDLRRCGIHCYELCRITAYSRREITLVLAALAERGSRARFIRWLTDRLGSPTHYKLVQLQYSGGLTIKLIGSTPRGTWLGAGQRASGSTGLGRILSNPHEFLSSRKVLDYMIETLLQTNADYVSAFLRIIAGMIIFPYGMQKLFGWFGGWGIKKTLKQMTLKKIPKFIAWLVIVGQSF